MTTDQTADIRKSERTYRVLAWVVPPILMFIAFVILSINQNQITSLNRVKQDFLTQRQAAEDGAAFQQYIGTHPTEIQAVDTALPNEQMLVGFLGDLESVVRQADDNSKVNFVGTTPVRQGVDLVIPVVVRFTSPLETLPDLLESISRLPYLMQLSSIESTTTEKGTEHVIGYKLFVQEPFSGL